VDLHALSRYPPNVGYRHTSAVVGVTVTHVRAK
jgi:hypothetical protein